MGWHWGILASSGGAAGSFDLLETTLISSNTASVTFSNLNNYAAYRHLQIRMVVRTNRAEVNDEIWIRANSDSGSNYSQHQLQGNGAAVSSFAQTGQTAARLANVTAANMTANAFAPMIVDVLDFSSSSKNTTFRAISGYPGISGWNFSALHSSAWFNTAAVTSLTILPGIGTNLVSGCRLSLYGVK